MSTEADKILANLGLKQEEAKPVEVAKPKATAQSEELTMAENILYPFGLPKADQMAHGIKCDGLPPLEEFDLNKHQ